MSALAALSSGRSWRAFALGVQWGCGHSLGIVSIAVVFLALGHAVDLGVFRDVCNYMAGTLLVLLGLWTLYHAKREYELQTKPLSKWSAVECQDASYTLITTDDARSVGVLGDFFWTNHSEYVSGNGQTLASVLVGLVHGVAGPGGVLGVIPVLAMHRTLHAVVYLACFCASSVLCMGVFAALYGRLTQWCASHCSSGSPSKTKSSKSPSAISSKSKLKRMSINDSGDDVDSNSAHESARESSARVAYRIATVSSLLSIVVGVTWIVLQARGVLEQVFGHDSH